MALKKSRKLSNEIPYPFPCEFIFGIIISGKMVHMIVPMIEQFVFEIDSQSKYINHLHTKKKKPVG